MCSQNSKTEEKFKKCKQINYNYTVEMPLERITVEHTFCLFSQ